jgi:hypothetical protein
MKSSRWLLLPFALCLLPVPLRAAFQPALARLDLDRSQVHTNEHIQATWTFRSRGSATEDLAVFVHLIP